MPPIGSNDDKIVGGSEKVPEISWQTAVTYLNNIILVGTKLDLCWDPPTTPSGKPTQNKKRKVQFDEVIAFSRQMNLAGCIEVSSKTDMWRNIKSNGPWADLKDAFLMVSCMCYD